VLLHRIHEKIKFNCQSVVESMTELTNMANRWSHSVDISFKISTESELGKKPLVFHQEGSLVLVESGLLRIRLWIE
jgi:hypothetical protein